MNIKLRNISLNFGLNQVINRLSLDFKSGKINCLLGKSGSGKTSILRIIAGVSPEFSGDVLFDETLVTSFSPKERNIGWVPQEQLLFPSLDIRGNIEYGLIARGMQKELRNKRVKEVSKLVGLEDLINRSPSRLSGGERQRVALGRALAPEPEFLLMDEPFSSLDAPERDRLSILFREIQLETGVTSVHVTHSPQEAETIGDLVYILSKGQIIQHDTVLEIFSKPKSIEVAQLLGIKNLVRSGQLGDSEGPAIIPDNAIKLNLGSDIAKIISTTRDNIHLMTNDGLKLTVRNQDNHSYKPGEVVKFQLDKSLLYRF